jgi:hypothetical protein
VWVGGVDSNKEDEDDVWRRAELLERARVRSIQETITFWGIDFAEASEETEDVPSGNGLTLLLLLLTSPLLEGRST